MDAVVSCEIRRLRHQTGDILVSFLETFAFVPLLMSAASRLVSALVNNVSCEFFFIFRAGPAADTTWINVKSPAERRATWGKVYVSRENAYSCGNVISRLVRESAGRPKRFRQISVTVSSPGAECDGKYIKVCSVIGRVATDDAVQATILCHISKTPQGNTGASAFFVTLLRSDFFHNFSIVARCCMLKSEL